ncbi:hypothetical protein [Sporolactobacillus terrae]|uniref:hypothetical protein n=1 Tax=Sporolactobacillus terrae TaxID=269673 RepID=UPI00048E3BBA|nr:hypothetical protein [Sporolactobacillus terrae]
MSKNDLNILSLNVNNFGGNQIKKITKDWNSPDQVLSRLIRAIDIWQYIMKSKAQIILLEEFENNSKVGKCFIKLLKSSGFTIVRVC